MRLQAGQEAIVRVSAATLGTRPEAVRPIDGPALAARTDLGTWISAMSDEQQTGDCVLSQLLLGERVLVEQVRDDGWAGVIAVEQPAASRDPRGYPGWVPAEQLVAAEPAGAGEPDEPLVVDATTTGLRAAPDGEVLLPQVILGTRLGAAGPPRQGWRPVRVPGHDRPLWAPESDLVPLPSQPPTAAEVLAVAYRLRDVAYVWGGVSAYGIDCSGLVHLAWRRFGVRLPRDAHDQARATTPLPLGSEQPGDLYYFARPGRTIHHTGFVAADPGAGDSRRLLHACYSQRRVLEEPMTAERVETLVAAHRV